MIGIIGGGISGLTLAYYLQKAGKEYVLFESSSRFGGSIYTDKETKRELGPNTILEDAYVKNLIQELGIEDEVVEANPISKDRYILKGGKIKKLPTHPLKLITSNFFSWKTKREILGELSKPYQEVENETIKAFFIRRFGKEIYEYAVNPFVSGIYAGDPEKLLIEEAFPQLKEYEKEYGSVIKGFKKNKSKERKRTLSFKKGLSYLTESIADQLDNVYLNTPVEGIVPNGRSYVLSTAEKEFNVSKVVLALPAKQAGQLLTSMYPLLSEKLHHIEYPPMSVVHTIVDSKQMKSVPKGFGMLHPKVENCFAAGTIWNSSIFPSDEETFVFTSFVGGSQYADKATLGEEVKSKVWNELKSLYQLPKESLQKQYMYHWDRSIPQYDANLAKAVRHLPELEKENIFTCSNWYQGISLPSCIKKGKELALKLTVD